MVMLKSEMERTTGLGTLMRSTVKSKKALIVVSGFAGYARWTE